MTFPSHTVRAVQCINPGKIERDGKFYCGIHDPVRVDAEYQKREAKYQEKYMLLLKAREKEQEKAKERDRKLNAYETLVNSNKELIAALNKTERLLRTTDAYHYATDSSGLIGLGEYILSTIAANEWEGAGK